MSQSNYNALIEDLGKNVGLEDLKPDSDNYCCLGFDEEIVVHIQYNEEHDVLMFFGQLGVIEEEHMAELCPKLLKANLMWQGTAGGTIGLDDQTREVLISYQLPLGNMDFPKFQEILEGFVNTAEVWIKTLKAIQSGDLAPKDTPPEGLKA